MSAHKANLINALTLFFVSLWAYFGSLNPSMRDLIPLLFGVILLSLNNGVLYGLKGQVRAAMVITFLVTLILIKLFSSAMNNGKTDVLISTGLMISTGIVAIIFLIRGK
ncbi:MAG: hypothetical protein WBP08_09585 [Saprospiraceae bacterium]|nr:hypothetical protein [Saprospiraceae bacterium]